MFGTKQLTLYRKTLVCKLKVTLLKRSYQLTVLLFIGSKVSSQSGQTYIRVGGVSWSGLDCGAQGHRLHPATVEYHLNAVHELWRDVIETR